MEVRKSELLEKANFIQYPLTYGKYKNYSTKDIIKLPLPQKGEMYDGWNKNENHFTTEYHRLYSIPLLCKLFGINYNENDFILDIRNCGKFDISILKTKSEYKYEIYGFTRNEHFDNLSFNEITTNTSISNDITDYHKLYRYSHECSRLINKTINNNRVLFISGDSHMIPNISFLSCFFKEIWYFDNRKNIDLKDKTDGIIFTDVLVELNHLSEAYYINQNIQFKQ